MTDRPRGYNGWQEYLMAQRRKPSHQWVAIAVKSGKIPRPANCICVDCGKKAYCYDHRDYRAPHLVDPVCKKCDSKRGPGFPRHYSEMFTTTEIRQMIAKKRAFDCRERIREMAKAGISYPEIGRVFGISRQRARQLALMD